MENDRKAIIAIRKILDSMDNHGFNSINRQINDVENALVELNDLYEHYEVLDMNTGECKHCNKEQE